MMSAFRSTNPAALSSRTMAADLNGARERNRSVTDVAIRAFDIVVAVTVLLLCLPLLIAAVIAIRLESPGPAVFRQRRMGRHGREFELLKLRGMYVDAVDAYPELYAYELARREDGFHRRDDPRITRVGRFVRKLSIDELPNFVNVLRGEMSVVGPRPEIPELAHLYGDSLETFLSVKPGVTSPAKARGRDALTFEQTLELELDYARRRSFRLDLDTILRTAVTAPRGRNVT
jgi:lipopolysaccharide/colanic/teichoic acid biosynthesis glycosyltransferase